MATKTNNSVTIFLALFAISILGIQCKNNKRYLPVLGVSTIDPVTKDTIYHSVGNFTATDQFGQIITQDTFRDNIYVANFFFVTCPGICKQMNNELERVQKAFAGDRRIKFVSFTVNPEQDTIAALAGYAKLHNAIPYQWYFLRTEQNQVLDLARHSYLAETQGYIIHSPNLTLIDSREHIRGIYSGVIPAEVDRLIADIKLLVKEERDNGIHSTK